MSDRRRKSETERDRRRESQGTTVLLSMVLNGTMDSLRYHYGIIPAVDYKCLMLNGKQMNDTN